MRGVTGVTVPTNHAGARTQYNNLLGIGRSFKGSDDAFFHNAMFYLIAEADSTIAGSARRQTFFSLLPGMLTQLAASRLAQEDKVAVDLMKKLDDEQRLLNPFWQDVICLTQRSRNQPG